MIDAIIDRLDLEIAEAIEVIRDQMESELSTEGRALIAAELLRVQRSTLLAAAVFMAGEPQGDTAAPTPSSRFADSGDGVTFR